MNSPTPDALKVTVADVLSEMYVIVRLPRFRWSELRFSCVTCRALHPGQDFYLRETLSREDARRRCRCIVFDPSSSVPATLVVPFHVLARDGELLPFGEHLYCEVRPVLDYMMGEPLRAQRLGDGWKDKLKELPGLAPWECRPRQLQNE